MRNELRRLATSDFDDFPGLVMPDGRVKDRAIDARQPLIPGEFILGHIRLKDGLQILQLTLRVPAETDALRAPRKQL